MCSPSGPAIPETSPNCWPAASVCRSPWPTSGSGAVRCRLEERAPHRARPVRPGDRVIAREPPQVEAESPLRVVHTDDDLLIIDKPSGVLAQPSTGELDSLATRVTRLYPEARVAHRLDRDTSGLTLFTLQPRSHAAMQQAFAGRDVVREYIALCAGWLDAPRDIRLRIAPDPRDRSKRRTLPESARADSRLSPECTRSRGPREGRSTPRWCRSPSTPAEPTRSAPPVGGRSSDHRRQALRRASGARLMLHATRLAFRHPHTGALLDQRSPEPPGFRT